MADDKTASLRKRFYKTVDVAPQGAAFGVLLDGRTLKTPGRLDLALRTEALARAIADEWQAQDTHIRPHSMPTMQIACTAIERIPRDRTVIEQTLCAYAGTDLLCYRAAAPADLVQRQTDMWQPVLDWLEREHGARLTATTSVIAVAQPPASLARVAELLAALDDHELAALSVLTQCTGSFALAYAAAAGHLDADQTADAAQLEERFQSELWGQDREAEMRLRALRADIAAAVRYLHLHRG